jgi:hypothetical protein
MQKMPLPPARMGADVPLTTPGLDHGGGRPAPLAGLGDPLFEALYQHSCHHTHSNPVTAVLVPAEHSELPERFLLRTLHRCQRHDNLPRADAMRTCSNGGKMAVSPAIFLCRRGALRCRATGAPSAADLHTTTSHRASPSELDSSQHNEDD